LRCVRCVRCVGWKPGFKAACFHIDRTTFLHSSFIGVYILCRSVLYEAVSLRCNYRHQTYSARMAAASRSPRHCNGNQQIRLLLQGAILWLLRTTAALTSHVWMSKMQGCGKLSPSSWPCGRLGLVVLKFWCWFWLALEVRQSVAGFDVVLYVLF